MNLYSILCISLTLAHQGFTNVTESPNDGSTFSSTESASLEFSVTTKLPTNESTSSTPESTFNSTESTFNSTESTFNSTESTFNATESTFNATESTQLPPITSTTSPCPENMEVWPMKNMGCFCVRPFLAIPLNGTCCKPYRQGPCPPGHFVPQSIFSSHNSEVPRCIPNPCVNDGLVPANGTCIDITTRPLCTIGFAYYNERISELRCIRAQFRPRTAIRAPYRRCPVGTHPDKYGKCRRSL